MRLHFKSFRTSRFFPFIGIFVTLFLLIISVILVKQEQHFITKAQTVPPTKIMIVGDSISHGHSGDYTWRYRLWQHLTNDNVLFDFVGPRTDLYDDNNPNGTHDYIDPNFDQDHDATIGRPVLYEKDTIAAEMQAAQPDILLVFLGTNDLIYYTSPAAAATNMQTFIANARLVNPNIKIVLAQITPRTVAQNDAWITNRLDYNSRLISLTQQITATASPVVIADPNTNFDPAVDTFDGTHPSPSGDYKIAAAFADALANNFGIGTTYGPIPPAPAWPPAPTTVTTQPLDRKVKIDWSIVPGSTGYYVYMRNSTQGTQWERLQEIAVTTTTFTKDSLTNGDAYEFAVSAGRWSFEGPMSDPVQVVPNVPLLPAPSNFTLTPLDGGTQMNWDAVPGANGYYFYMRDVTLGESEFTRSIIPVYTNSFTGGLMTNGHTYEFKLTTINSVDKEGPFSNTVSVVPTAPTPTPTPIPTNTPTPTPTPTAIPTPTKTPTLTPTPTPAPGLTGAYFTNTKTLSGSPIVTRVDGTVNFNWGTAAPATGVSADNFSVRWTGYVKPAYSQQYTFFVKSDDGVRLWVNGVLLVDKWTNHSATEYSGKISLVAATKYSIKVEYYDNTGPAVAQLSWSSSSQAKQIIPSTRLYTK